MFGTLNNAQEQAPRDLVRIERASTHQVTILPNDDATGILNIAVFPMGWTDPSGYALVQDSEGVLAINLTGGVQVFQFDAATHQILLVPTSSIEEGYQAIFSGW